MAALGTLKDLFTASALNTQAWTQFTGGSATMSYGGPGATCTFPSTTSSSTDGDVSSNTTYDLTSSFGLLNVTSVSGASAVNTDCVFRLRQNATNYVEIFYEAGTLYFSKTVAAAKTNIANVAYSASTHAWWQIRESGGTTYWETSTDGLSWTTRASEANPITLTALTLVIGGICFGADSSPTPFRWRYFNTPTSTPGINNYFKSHLVVGDGMGRSEMAN